MPLTTFTLEQCNKMNTAINKVILNKMGIHHNMPKEVLYSSLEMGGLNHPSFEVIQDQKVILYLLQQLRWKGTIANDMLTVLSAVQLVPGWCTPVLMNVTKPLTHVAKGWFTYVHERLNNMEGCMWIEDQWCLNLQREGDQSLMESFANTPTITTAMIKKANCCRIYARIITISDTAHENGEYIPGSRMAGRWTVASELEWPDFRCPLASYWLAFCQCVRRAFATKATIGRLTSTIPLDTKL